MLIFLTGSNGFIGRRLADALVAARHQVICAVRDPGSQIGPGRHGMAVDFARDVAVADWLPRLAGVEVVINAVGILREHGAQTFDALHTRAPCALFAACADAGVARVIQISALGADSAATSRYHLSKKAADDFLANLPIASTIVQPSLVFGADGASTRLFTLLAGLPVIPLPGHGEQQVQPVHIDDVVELVVRLVDQTRQSDRGNVRIAAVGPKPITLGAFLASLRQELGMGRAPVLPVPMPLVRVAAHAARIIPGMLLDAETLAMLERGNTGDAGPITQLLGRPTRAVESLLAPAEAPALRLRTKLRWLLPMLRIAIALVWIVTGIVSFGLYPITESYALLARTGITGALAPLMLYGAALMDLAIGFATLALRRRRWLWYGQLAMIGFYTLVITFRLPEFWLHPYGPLLKNLPMLAAIVVLLTLEEDFDEAPIHRHN